MSSKITRRTFTAGALSASAALTAGRSARAFSANEKIRLGFIGIGNRGDQLIEAFKPHADAEFAALCDLYQPYLDAAAKKVGGDPFVTKDFRQIIDRKDIDAVVIATPDHWHAIPYMLACEAGKDVYVEKPSSLVVNEGRAMVAAAKKHKRVVQVGIHRRSVKNCGELVKLIHDGAIGKVTSVRCFHTSNEWPIGLGAKPDSDPPAGFDWDMWLGPAPKVPYNENRCFYKFRWFRDYSGGQVTNMATHWLDLIQWAIQQDAPRGVFAVGSNTIKDNRGIPDTMEVVWDYPDGTLVSYSQYNTNAADGAPEGAYVEFRGTEGTLYYSGSVTVVPEAVRAEPMPALNPTARKENARQAAARKPSNAKAVTIKGQGSETVNHARNFLDCMKSRKECRCSIETGHRSSVTTLIANIACDRKKYLAWDAQNERFTNDDEANKALAYEYRAPWKFPVA